MVCHASAWDIDDKDDLRLKMCIQINAEDFVTIHHELGHNFYQRAYNEPAVPLSGQRQRRLPRGDRRHHRALGHAGVPEEDRAARQGAADASKDIGLLLKRALEKVAFLPFGLLIDQWRWKVFSGEITPDQLQQGVVGPAAEVSGRRAAGRRARRGFRSRRQVSRAGQHAVHALFPGAHSAVPVSPRAVPGRRSTAR